MKILSIEPDYSFDGPGQIPKVFRTRGCSCCSETVRITEESIAEAILETEEWLEELKSLRPETYPED